MFLCLAAWPASARLACTGVMPRLCREGGGGGGGAGEQGEGGREWGVGGEMGGGGIVYLDLHMIVAKRLVSLLNSSISGNLFQLKRKD